MGILKKIRKAITKKSKNRKGKPASTASASSSKDFLEEIEKPSENILSVETTIEQQIPYPTAITDTAINIETTTCDNSNTTTIEGQDTLSATLIVEAMEITAQEQNTPDNPSPIELCFDSGSGKGNSTDEKSSKKAILPIVAGVVLLVSCVASYLLIEHSKMHVIAVVGGIVVLAIISFALYDLLKPDTKLEKVENVKQLDVHSAVNPT